MFDALQKAMFGGKPVKLYIFRRQGVEMRFASGQVDYTNGAYTYTGAQIDSGEYKETVERAKDKLNIKFAYLLDPNPPSDQAIPSTQVLGDWWNPRVARDRIDVVVLNAHRGDSDTPKIEFQGVVSQPKFNSDVELELVCEPYGASARARGQGFRWQKACPKAVYSTGPRGCNLDRDAFKVDATPTVSGLQLTADEFAAAPLNLAGGWWEWTDGDGWLQKDYIVSHSANKIVLLSGGNDLGTAGTARPICQKTYDACSVRHADPWNHYGGAIYKPIKNPTDGVSMSWG